MNEFCSAILLKAEYASRQPLTYLRDDRSNQTVCVRSSHAAYAYSYNMFTQIFIITQKGKLKDISTARNSALPEPGIEPGTFRSSV